MFATLSASYCRVLLDLEPGRIELGGLRAGIGLGAAF